MWKDRGFYGKLISGGQVKLVFIKIGKMREKTFLTFAYSLYLFSIYEG